MFSYFEHEPLNGELSPYASWSWPSKVWFPHDLGALSTNLQSEIDLNVILNTFGTTLFNFRTVCANFYYIRVWSENSAISRIIIPTPENARDDCGKRSYLEHGSLNRLERYLNTHTNTLQWSSRVSFPTKPCLRF